MKPSTALAGAQVGLGVLLVRRPAWGLRLLGYPSDTMASRSVVRLLGSRHVVQGAAVVVGNRKTLWAATAVDAVHAITCIVYARHSVSGRRAGLRSAAVAISLAAIEAAAACSWADTTAPPSSATGGTRRPAADHQNAKLPIARVSSANAAAWPEPTDEGQHVLVEMPVSERTVRLTGGVMDGATVIVPPGATSYEVNDTDSGRQRYVATGKTDGTGSVVFAHQRMRGLAWRWTPSSHLRWRRRPFRCPVPKRRP